MRIFLNNLRQQTRRKSSVSSSDGHSSFVRRHYARLRARHPDADPVSLFASFAILHELTAILPVGLFFYAFQSVGLGERMVATVERQRQDNDQADVSMIQRWTQDAQAKSERVAKRYGLFGYADDSIIDEDSKRQLSRGATDLAGAYLIVKLLMPVRLAACFWLSPPLANLVGRSKLIKRWFRPKTKTTQPTK